MQNLFLYYKNQIQNMYIYQVVFKPKELVGFVILSMKADNIYFGSVLSETLI